MKKFVLFGLIIFFNCSASFAAYFNDDISQGAGSYGYGNSQQVTSTTQINRIGNTYYNGAASYTRQGNHIYGSDGSQYTDYGGFIQSSSGKTYQVNNNFVQELQ